MRAFLLMLSAIFILLIGATAQNRSISGRVTSSTGDPIPGASVLVKGTSIGTTTNSDGTYVLSVPANARTLVISSIDMATQEVNIRGTSVDVALITSAASNLQEVVVVGYGTQKRKSLTGAISQINAREVTGIQIASIDQILQGKSTGVQVTAVNGRPGANAYVKIRGTGSINAGSTPLYVIDGVPAANLDVLNTINPNDIDNISVLKDAASSAIYGSRASNGVILITTKRGRPNRPQLTYRFNYGQKAKTPDNFEMMNASEKIQYEYNIGKQFGSFVGAGSRGNFAVQAAIAQLVAANQLPTGTNNVYSLNQDQLNQVIDKTISIYGDNNWQDILLRKGQVKTHEISLSGGTDKLRYYTSMQNYNEEGIGLRSKFQRNTGRLNVEYQAKDWLKIGNNFSASYTNDKLLRDRYNAQSPFYAMYAYNPYEPPFLPGTTNSMNPIFLPVSPYWKQFKIIQKIPGMC